MKAYWLLAILILLSACSNKAVYENVKWNNQIECLRLPPDQYDECMERSSKSYEEYESERQETLEKKP